MRGFSPWVVLSGLLFGLILSYGASISLITVACAVWPLSSVSLCRWFPPSASDFDSSYNVPSIFGFPSTWKDLADASQRGRKLAIEITQTDGSLWDLHQIIKVSDLPSKFQLSEKFRELALHSRTVSKGLNKFDSYVGQTLDYIQNAQIDTAKSLQLIALDPPENPTIGAVLLYVYRNAVSTLSDRQAALDRLQSRFGMYATGEAEKLKRMIRHGHGIENELEQMERIIEDIVDLALGDDQAVNADLSEKIDSFWYKWFGGHKGKIAKLYKNKEDLIRIYGFCKVGRIIIKETVDRLQKMGNGLEELRGALGTTEFLEDPNQLRIQLSSIRLAIERVDEIRKGRQRIEGWRLEELGQGDVH